MGSLDISDEMAKSSSRAKVILLLSRNIAQTMSGEVKDEIRKTYQSGGQYLAFPETKEVRGEGDLDTFLRPRDGAGSWEMARRLALLLIKTCIRQDQKRKSERNAAISTVKFQISLRRTLLGGIQLFLSAQARREREIRSPPYYR